MPWWLPRSMPWETAFPLPRDTTRFLLEHQAVSDNAGLAMDRLLAYDESRRGMEFVRELMDRRALVPDYSSQEELINAFGARWQAMAATLGASTFRAVPEWRIIVGLGTHRLLEGGISLHSVYGLPIVPASALKGITRFFAEVVAEAPAEQVDHLFGREELETVRGDLVFLDGIPAAPPHMERDVINPHWSSYYGGEGNVAPADTMNPRPVFFITVGRHSPFQFGLASLSDDAEAVDQGLRWMQGALRDLGVGAKSAAGYGYWVIDGDAQYDAPS